MATSFDAATGKILNDLLERARVVVREFADIEAKTKANAASSEESLKAVADAVTAMTVLQNSIAEIIARNIPGHVWQDSVLRLMNPDGQYGAPVDLKGERGERGEQGFQGIQGERGLKGDKGDRGERGRDGPAGEQGTPFEVNEKGNLSGRVAFDNQPKGFSYLAIDVGLLFFREELPGVWSDGLPFGRGEKGETGERGPSGLDGERGPAGIDGINGERGLKGDKGDKGDTGDQGEKGEPGEPALIPEAFDGGMF